jgi:CheY-like chemotaxis protein
MSTRALIVEDDPRVVEEIEDILDSLGHEHAWASNLADARKAVAAEDFAYVLLDLEIPTKPNRGVAVKENGAILLEEIQRIKGFKRLPVIVMTGHVGYCLDRSNELREKGANAFIQKPFPTESHTLPSAIRKVLKDHRRQTLVQQACRGDSVAEASTFAGGEVVFFDDHVELLGVKIISDRGGGTTMQVLGELRRRDSAGRFVRRSAEELAKAVRAMGGVSTITGCVRALRQNITRRLRKHLNIDVHPEGVIGHDEQGYYLQDCISVRDAGDADPDGDGPAAPSADLRVVPTAQPDVPARGSREASLQDLNERQQWVLRELQRGTRVQRAMLEQKFDVADKTAKRDLADLTARGAVEFVRVGRDGYYRLAVRTISAVASQRNSEMRG